MKAHISSDDNYERQLCFHCELDECDQTAQAGCELKVSGAKQRREIYLFIARMPRSIQDIHKAFPNDGEFVTDSVILLSQCELIKFRGGMWRA